MWKMPGFVSACGTNLAFFWRLRASIGPVSSVCERIGSDLGKSVTLQADGALFMQIDNLYKQFQEAQIEFQIILCDKKQTGSSLRAACWFRLFRIAHESNSDGQNWIESVPGSLRF